MSVFFKISESLNDGPLHIHKHSDSDNMYFENRGVIGDSTKTDETDYGQYWCASTDPTASAPAQAIYNTFTESLLGSIGIYTEANIDNKSGTLLGGVTFLSTLYNGKILFEKVAGNPALYTIRFTDNDAKATNYYICYIPDTPEVGIVEITNITNPPSGVSTQWKIKILNNNAALAATQ